MKKEIDWSKDHKYKNLDPLKCPNKIRLLRFAKGWSSGDLARSIGTGRGVILDYERGRLNPGWNVVNRLCEEFEVEAGDLFWRKGEKETLLKQKEDKNGR